VPLPAAAPSPAAAQVAPPEPEEKVYTYDHSAAGSQRALTQELQRLLVVPAGTKAGMVFVEFTVQPTGVIHNAHIFKSLNPVADAAALQAISQLPTLQPGKQNGRLVAVRYILALKVPGGS
jgi:TonB family protein